MASQRKICAGIDLNPAYSCRQGICGTCRFGEDPKTSVLDLNCLTHDIENLYVVDGSFFRSSAAANPTLIIIANALRVGNHLLERMQ